MTTESRDDATRACANLAAALRQCLPLLRDQMLALMENIMIMDRDGRPQPLPADDPDADEIASIIAAIRTAEALVGRVPDDCPDWLNEVIDGTREWRA